jgi:hypothetical protein
MFSSKKEEKAPSTTDSIQKLRETENMLLKKQEFLEQKLEQELDIAKKNASTNKRGELKYLFYWIYLPSDLARLFRHSSFHIRVFLVCFFVSTCLLSLSI